MASYPELFEKYMQIKVRIQMNLASIVQNDIIVTSGEILDFRTESDKIVTELNEMKEKVTQFYKEKN